MSEDARRSLPNGFSDVNGRKILEFRDSAVTMRDAPARVPVRCRGEFTGGQRAAWIRLASDTACC